MKKFVACLAALACVAPSAMAAQVSFDGSPITVIEGEGAALQIDVWLDSAFGGDPFETMDLMIGSDTVPMLGFEYGPEAALSLFPPGVPRNTPGDLYPHTLRDMGWFIPIFTGNSPSAPLYLGTLTVDASGLGLGDHFLYVGDGGDRGDQGGDPNNRDGGTSKAGLGAESDFMRGTGVISVVVPEPATLALLGLGAIGFIARRKKA